MSWVVVAVIIVVILAIVIVKIPRKQEGQSTGYSYRKLRVLFTPAERSFLGVLNQAVGENAQIFGKVRVADVIIPEKGLSRSEWQKAFNKISGKHFDFILCDKNDLSILCAIELNDGSHNLKNRKDRDAFLKSACDSANVPLISIAASGSYNINEIRNCLSDCLPGLKEQKLTGMSADANISPPAPEGERLCPKCSAVMVKRVAKKGKHAGNEFWACSAFPKCRHTEAINA